MKIAVVKQECYQDLYNCAPDAPPLKKVFSSFQRVGMAAFFTRHNADFYIVAEEKDQECQIWQQKAVSRPLSYYRGFREKHQPHVKKCGEINWGEYQIVVSLDVSVPARITRKFKKTLWCYMISEGYMGAYNKPCIAGYDAKLNQMMGGKISGQTVNFPYAFIDTDLYGLMEQHLGREPRNFIFQEANSFKKNINMSALGKTVSFGDTMEQTLINEYDSKYIVKIGGRKVRGNGLVEAIANGTLVLCNPSTLIYVNLLPPITRISSLADAKNKIGMFNSNPDRYRAALEAQKKVVHELIYRKPYEALVHLYKVKTK